MPTYDLTVYRTEMKSKTFRVEAADEGSAAGRAEDRAHDFNFYQASASEAEYEVDGIEEVENP
jgi:hypothetical protein